ncbi:MAG: hypothetical protein HWN81_14465 [Candidatus Lokiarchaeota archaeon]|nr:hypothetical protein [Candidatus Lokiarchaeota archaeon]
MPDNEWPDHIKFITLEQYFSLFNIDGKPSANILDLREKMISALDNPPNRFWGIY